jgi:hypothetical protein
MDYTLISAIVVLGSFFASVTNQSAFELPKTWTKDFTISIVESGGMQGISTRVTYTYDSCKYVQKKESSFALTEADRVAILKKMRELKADKIKSEISPAPVDDGWSSLLCFPNHCVEGGTSAIMSDADKERFSSAFGYLEDFALKRLKK